VKNWLVEFTFPMPEIVDWDRFEADAERVLEALDALDGVLDPDGGVNYGDRLVSLTFSLVADNYFDAVAGALTAVRTAIHTAGIPGWEQMIADILTGGTVDARREDTSA
jgi:hypothetical protein